MARKRYNKGKRIDMRQGGRVALARGGNRGAKRTATPKKPIVREDRPVRTPLGPDDRPMRPNDQPDLPTSTPPPMSSQTPLTRPQKPKGTKDILKDPAPAPQKERPMSSPEQLYGKDWDMFPTPPDSVPTKEGMDTVTNAETQQEPTSVQPDFYIDRDDPYFGEPQPTVYTPEQQNPAAVAGTTSTVGTSTTASETSQGGGMWWKDAGFDTFEDAINAGWYWNNQTGQWTNIGTPGNPDTTGNTDNDNTGTESGFDSKAYAQQLAQGEGPTGKAVIPDAEKVGGIQRDAEGNPILDSEGNTIPIVRDMSETEMLALTEEQRAAATKAGYTPDETVTTGISTEAKGFLEKGFSFTPPEDKVYPQVMPPEGMKWAYGPNGERISVPQGTKEGVKAGTYTGDTIDEETAVNAKTLEELSPGSTADLQTQSLTMQAQGVDVTADYRVGDEKTLTDRVIGTLGPEAMAEFQKVAGTDLPRVLRAKKQLRRAGLTENQINLIGNDPELLEDELMNYTEAERGMIAGLPDEALVSTQLTSLLDGIESGEIPTFARPAVAAVNEMLLARGLSASTVGRDALINSLITAAMPLAQSNAQSIKESVMSQRTIEAQAEQLNAQMRQQTALDRADKTFSMNMAQFTSDQQIALSNSKFLQTVTLTDASNDQQAMMQNAASMAQLDLATLDSNTRLTAQNAQAFLQLDMTNLNNKQQSEVLRAKMNQDRMLSNQASTNASLQFNATSENQTNQFMANLKTQIDLNNVARQDSMEQFNATQDNAKEARRVGIAADIAKFDAQLVTQVDQFNAQQDFARNQWNAQNAAAVEASNIEWRRQANTINTAAQNAINAQNAQNAFQMSSQSLAFLWQELRDQADFDFRAVENEENRKAQIVATALANEGKSGEKYDDYLTGIVSGFAQSLNNAYRTFPSQTPGP